MEGYDVVSNDDQKVGQVVDKQNGYLIVESGLVRNTGTRFRSTRRGPTGTRKSSA